MDFRQLEAFVKTVELGSFSKAADLLYISQPSVSVHVRALEKELGTALLTRSSKEVAATKDGRLFYEYAKNILSLRDKAVFELKSRTAAYQGELEIHASSVPAQYILPEIIAGFSRAYPNISFDITMSDTFSVISGVAAQRCELGVVGARVDNGKCDYRFIVSESIVLIAPPDSPLTAENLRESIYTENFITREEGSATQYHAGEYLEKMGVDFGRLRVVAQLTNQQSIVHAVSKGLGVSIVSEIAAREYIRNKLVRIIRPDGFDLKRNFYFVYRKDAILPPKLNVFMNYVCQTYAAANPPQPDPVQSQSLL